MVRRSIRLAASLAAASAAFAGCAQDQATPVAVETVRLTVIAGSEHGGAPFSTPMSQEVTATPPWSGDPDGTGTALLTVNRGQREVCWDLSVSGIVLPATFAHIHKAPPGVRGGVVVTLGAPDNSGRSTGCASNVDPAVLSEILVTPESFYVNVHTTDFPAGAVRGQLGN